MAENLDFNDAGEQRVFDVIPANTICTLQINIRRGGAGDEKEQVGIVSSSRLLTKPCSLPRVLCTSGEGDSWKAQSLLRAPCTSLHSKF